MPQVQACLERAVDDVDDASLRSMSPELSALVLVHLGMRLPAGARQKLMARQASGGAARRPTQYAPGRAVVVTAADLLRLTPRAAAFVAAVLWFADFKWVDIDRAGGVGTRAHFGYGRGRPRSCEELAAFKLGRGRLSHGPGRTRAVKRVEVPLRPDLYILVC